MGPPPPAPWLPPRAEVARWLALPSPPPQTGPGPPEPPSLSLSLLGKKFVAAGLQTRPFATPHKNEDRPHLQVNNTTKTLSGGPAGGALSWPFRPPAHLCIVRILAPRSLAPPTTYPARSSRPRTPQVLVLLGMQLAGGCLSAISLRFSFVSSHLIHMEPAATAGPTKPQLARRLAGQDLDQRLRIERSTLLIRSDGSRVGQWVWNCDERERERVAGVRVCAGGAA
jgi:hypothetical protein